MSCSKKKTSPTYHLNKPDESLIRLSSVTDHVMCIEMNKTCFILSGLKDILLILNDFFLFDEQQKSILLLLRMFQ